MNAKDAIVQVHDTADRVVSAYLDGLSDADLLVRPVAGQNHIAWQLGHLISTERTFLETLKPGSSPPLPEGFETAHGRDDESTHSDDAARFQTKDKYLALKKAQREATLAYVSGLSESDLDAPAPEKFIKRTPTIGALLVLNGTHYLMHAGQFVSVRRKLAKPIAI